MGEQPPDLSPTAADNHASGIYSLTGQTLGKYRLLEKIGEGGMAQVYKAYQPDLDRYVAIKILHPHLTADVEFAERFRREARAIAALEHPHIVRIYDFDTDRGLAYLVMEYLEGASLRQRLRELDQRGERMELADAGRIVGALAEALDYAHQHGVIHRDLKPSNVIITAQGRAVLTDFGIARMVATTATTDSSGAMGTPAYMSPEQGQGEPADGRSDIYALGVILFQLCTGRVPFDADTPYAVILKHITAPLPLPHTIRPDLPEAIERVILKALAKRPTDRYQTGAEMASALQTALERPARAPVRRRQPRPTPAIAAALGVLLLSALVLLTRPWRLPLFQPRVALPTPDSLGRVTLTVDSPQAIEDTWIDPDTPEEAHAGMDLVHLQGPLTPDRVLLRFDLPSVPQGARVVSATLSLRVQVWGEQAFPAVAVAYRVLTPWDAAGCTYNRPWQEAGLAAGLDYDLTPLGMGAVPDKGLLALDVSHAMVFWYDKQEPNNGFVVMLSKDSHNQAHYLVNLSKQPDPADRPTLRLTYEVPR